MSFMLTLHIFYTILLSTIFFFFFFNDTATTEIYTLSLHDALPISSGLLRKNEWNQNNVAPITADRTRRLGDCSRDLRAPDPFGESCTRCPRRPGPHGSDP